MLKKVYFISQFELSKCFNEQNMGCFHKVIILFLMLYKSNKKVIHVHHTDFKLYLYIFQPASPK